MSAQTTVMGPEDSNTPGDFLQAPIFNTNTDKFQYRRHVRMWYQFVFSSARSGHNKAKGIASNLGISLYAKMAPRFQRIIDSAIDVGHLQFTNDDGTPLSDTDQISCINTIIDMIAKDSPTDRIRRLVKMNKDVYNCRRLKSESFPEYTSRFQSAANAYLSYANACRNGQDEQTFAMMLIENADLDLTTYNNIVKEMISDARDNNIEPFMSVQIGKLQNLNIQIKSIQAEINQLNSDSESNKNDNTSTCTVKTEKINHLSNSANCILESFIDIKIPNDTTRLKERFQYCLSLERAILALQDIKTKTELSPTFDNNEQNDYKPSQSTQKIGTMLMGHRNSDEKSKNRYFAQKRRSNRYHPNLFDRRRDQDRHRRRHQEYSDEDTDNDVRNDHHGKTIQQRLGKRNEYNRRSTGTSRQMGETGKDTGPPSLQSDLNPIYDIGAPKSTGGTEEAAKVCEVLGIPLILKPPRAEYLHGWGQECHDPKLISCTWDISICDRNNNPIILSFDLIKGSSPLVIGLDVARFADTLNNVEQPHISVRRPQDNQTYELNTYITPDNLQNPDCIRMRVNIFNLFPCTSQHITSMLTNLSILSDHDPKQLAKRIHRYTHAHPDQLRHICDRAGILNERLENAILQTDAACEVCTRNGRPLPSKKISLSHVNEAFNQEVQVDFTFFTANDTANPSIPQGTRYTIIVFTCTGTTYIESEVTPRRAIDEITSTYERVWLCRHGASKRLSADDEYNKPKLRDYLKCHGIHIKPRPTRRHNKTGIFERKHGVLKNILRRLVMEKSNDSMKTVLARATFLSNLFSGSQVLSAFELVKGYQPSILGIPQRAVSKEILNAHTEQVATRALQRVLRSRTPNIPTPGMFQPHDHVWIWYASSKNNEPNSWIPARVIKTYQHYLEVKRIRNGQLCRGPPMKPAYEDVRISPKGQLTRDLMAGTLEACLGYDDSTDQGEDRMNDDQPNNISTMLSKISPQKGQPSAKKGPANDIGPYSHQINERDEIIATLNSEKKRILDDIYNNVGSQQLSRTKLNFAPPWILKEAWDKEYESNWKDAYTPVEEMNVPRNANIITAHSVYKVKTDENGIRTLKGRIVPHGNRDSEKDHIRKDSSTAQLNVIRLLLSVVTFLGLRLASADIKGAYLQSGPIQRQIFVRPPQEWHEHPSYTRYTLWKLIKLPYGIVEAGRQ